MYTLEYLEVYLRTCHPSLLELIKQSRISLTMEDALAIAHSSNWIEKIAALWKAKNLMIPIIRKLVAGARFELTTFRL